MEQFSFQLLIADDEETILRGMKAYTTKYTQYLHKIYYTSDGQRALDMIFKYHPNVIPTGVQMLVKSDLDVIREACAVGLCPRMVVLSGYDTFSYT